VSKEQKPAGWIKAHQLSDLAPCKYPLVLQMTNWKHHPNDVALYTHPHRELTDDEIFKVASDYANAAMSVGGSMKTCVPLEIGFARAILKAARG